jgi:hypothetical protein
MDDDERRRIGLQNRRQVLGAEHVDRAEANTTDFNAPFQDLITRYAWGEIWERPGLPRHTRSLLTIAMPPRTTASRATSSARCCCSPPSTVACPRPTPRFTWPKQFLPTSKDPLNVRS